MVSPAVGCCPVHNERRLTKIRIHFSFHVHPYLPTFPLLIWIVTGLFAFLNMTVFQRFTKTIGYICAFWYMMNKKRFCRMMCHNGSEAPCTCTRTIVNIRFAGHMSIRKLHSGGILKVFSLFSWGGVNVCFWKCWCIDVLHVLWIFWDAIDSGCWPACYFVVMKFLFDNVFAV